MNGLDFTYPWRRIAAQIKALSEPPDIRGTPMPNEIETALAYVVCVEVPKDSTALMNFYRDSEWIVGEVPNAYERAVTRMRALCARHDRQQFAWVEPRWGATLTLDYRRYVEVEKPTENV